MNSRSRCALLLVVLLALLVNVPLTVADPCVEEPGTIGIDQLFTCPGADGVNVGSGDDTVNITGPVTGSIESSGGTLNVFIVEPDGSLNVADIAIYMNGDGDISSTGDVAGGLVGIYIVEDGDVYSTGDVSGGNGGILILGSGNVTSSGEVTGIYIGGNGDVNSTGDVSGIYVGGGGIITSIGDVTGDLYGIYIGGDGDVTSTGDVTGATFDGDDNITGGEYGIFVDGSGNVTSTGDVTGGNYGIVIAGGGNVTSIGNVTGGSVGIRIDGSGNVTSTGDVTGGSGIIVFGNGDITSTGDVVSTYGTGILIAGNGDVNSVGDVTGELYGILIAGNGDVTSIGNVTGNYGIAITGSGSGNVTSTGDVTGDQYGIYVSGNGEIDVRGSVSGQTAIFGGDGDDQIIVIDAVVTGNSGTAVRTQGGDDRVNLRGGADVHGDISMGSGDDTVQIGSGSRVDGTIDGGDHNNGDLLIVGDGSVCKENSEEVAAQVRNSELVENLNLSGDTFNYDGNNYTIENFEFGESGIRRRSCVPHIDDGRINGYDIGAWVAAYCNTEDGLNLWPIDLEGRGQVDISVSGATMKAALQEAVSTDTDVLIAAGPRGTTLWAMSWNMYRIVRPDQREPWKNYMYTFEPGTCGIGNRLDG